MNKELKPIEDEGFARNLMALAGGNWHFDTTPMVDRKLAGVELSDDKETLTFRFQDGGFVSYGAEGDCCSHSWIEHITIPPDVEGEVMVGYRDQSMGEEIEDGYDCIKVYQTSFVTAKGEIIVEYRNSSNGYYGGWLRGPIAQEGPKS